MACRLPDNAGQKVDKVDKAKSDVEKLATVLSPIIVPSIRAGYAPLQLITTRTRDFVWTLFGDEYAIAPEKCP